MGWMDILRSPDPSRALYLALRANPTASRAADTFQGGFEGAMEGLGRLGHVASIPARAITGAATNAAGLGAPIDVSDYAIYGRDIETGRQAEQYGDLLAGTLEDAGELKPGSFASKVIRLAGNTITDPAAAPALLSGAEAVGALGGAMTPSAPPMRPTMARRPLSSPTRPPAPPHRLDLPRPSGPIPLTKSPPPGPGQPGGPVRPGVTTIPQGPGPSPTDTQAVPARLQGSGSGPIGYDQSRTQPVPRFSPSGQPGWTAPIVERARLNREVPGRASKPRARVKEV